MVYSKADVQTHNDGNPFRGQYPAVNVKVYHAPSVEDVIERFGCSEKTAERALGYAFDMEQEVFWEDARDLARETFGSVKVYSAGRSGGWLIVCGLEPIDNWDAIALSRWRSFEKSILADVEWRTSKDVLLEDIAANEWAMDDSSLSRMLQEALA